MLSKDDVNYFEYGDKPKIGARYYFVSPSGEYCSLEWCEDDIDDALFDIGNVYPSNHIPNSETRKKWMMYYGMYTKNKLLKQSRWYNEYLHRYYNEYIKE